MFVSVIDPFDKLSNGLGLIACWGKGTDKLEGAHGSKVGGKVGENDLRWYEV